MCHVAYTYACARPYAYRYRGKFFVLFLVRIRIYIRSTLNLTRTVYTVRLYCIYVVIDIALRSGRHVTIAIVYMHVACLSLMILMLALSLIMISVHAYAFEILILAPFGLSARPFTICASPS